MAAKQQVEQPSDTVTVAATEALASFNAAVTQATERSRGALEAGLETWTREAQRFQDELSTQGASALEQLKGCKSPLDVLGVEQAWLAARQKAYLETGLRFAQAFASITQGLKDSEPPPPPNLA